jgi:hypothetical protein
MKSPHLIQKKEFGDFQTPQELSELMIDILKSLNLYPTKIIEPTCGLGNVLLQAYNSFWAKKTIGIEINSTYCSVLAKKINMNNNIIILNNDIFVSMDNIKKEIELDDLCLFIGNPPWVTNSELSILNSKNLPQKTNLKNLRGIEAITGKSNFDISEYIIIKLIEEFKENRSIYAFLCKTTVARNILKYCWNNHIKYNQSYIFPINSKKYFNAAVDACYFIIDASIKNVENKCSIYDSIENRKYRNEIGFCQNRLIANIENFLSHNYLGKSRYTWRNGIKHDCTKVMEFEVVDSKLINGYGEEVVIEDDLVYPLLKSSDIANGKFDIRKKVLVTQKNIGDETIYIKNNYPKTWRYLNNHIDDFEKRKSSIYKNTPPFSIFSIGNYCFYPYKIAISSLYKHLNFKVLYPYEGKPVMVDDTCNFISCNTEPEAFMIYSLLTCDEIMIFLNSIIFWDSKRPITTEILNSIDLKKIANEKILNDHYDVLLNYNRTVTNIESIAQMELF